MRDDTNDTFIAKWQWQPTVPTLRDAGVSGWALCDGKVKRLHVCAKSPCTARYPASKYGNVPPPIHVRLIEPALVAATTESGTNVALPALAADSEVASCGANEMSLLVVVTPKAASPEPSTGIAAPESPAVAGTRAASPDVPRLDVVVAGSSPVPDSIAPAVIGPDEEIAASKIAEKSEVAPPPPLAPKSSGEVVPPPERATLLPITSAAPCPPVAAPVVPQTTLIKPPAVAGPEDVDDEAVGASGLYDAKVAEEMNKFLVGLQAERHYVGISAFLIFALRYRLRVRVWYGTRCEDLLSVYAPWASDAISHNALFQAICCNYGSDKSLGLVEDDPRDTNHWVGCFPIGSGS